MTEASIKTINQVQRMIKEESPHERAVYLRPKQGMERYNMSRPQFCKLALEAGSLHNEDALHERYPDSSENIRNIIDVMVEIMMTTRPTIMISGNEYDSAYVKSRVFCIFERHVEYMLDCIKKNTTKVGNVKAYLRATIFNCTTTLGCYDDLTIQKLFAENYYA